MKIALAGILTLALLAAWHIPKLKKKKGIILIFYALGMIVLFAVYNIRTMDKIIRFSHPFGQIVYQSEFAATGEYPDAFLDEFFKGKTVYTKDDAFTVDEDHDINEEDGDSWLYEWYHAVNIWNYLKFNRASIVKDASLNGITLREDQRSHFTDLGPANDLLRYTFVLTDLKGEEGNGFYFYWFYSSHIGDARVYICPEKLSGSDELVLLWQNDAGDDTESYYIASKSFYDDVLAK